MERNMTSSGGIAKKDPDLVVLRVAVESDRYDVARALEEV
jgi:hypothetical protein